jgi:hypothetical protein
MYKHISELIVRVADLVEAEGRLLRKVVARMGLSLSLTMAAAALVLVGGVLLLAALWLAVAKPLGPALASVVSGIAALLLALGLLLIAARLNNEK